MGLRDCWVDMGKKGRRCGGEGRLEVGGGHRWTGGSPLNF